MQYLLQKTAKIYCKYFTNNDFTLIRTYKKLAQNIYKKFNKRLWNWFFTPKKKINDEKTFIYFVSYEKVTKILLDFHNILLGCNILFWIDLIRSDLSFLLAEWAARPPKQGEFSCKRNKREMFCQIFWISFHNLQ